MGKKKSEVNGQKSEKPYGCPFCGGEAQVNRHAPSLPEIQSIWWTVACRWKNHCKVWPSSYGNTRAEAIAAWNQRPATANGDRS